MGKMIFETSKDDPTVGYLYLPNHPDRSIHGVVVKQIRLLEIIEDYKGPDIYLDIDKNGCVIGLEILA